MELSVNTVVNMSDWRYSPLRGNRFISGFLNQDGIETPFLVGTRIYLDDRDVIHAAPDYDIEDKLEDINILLQNYIGLRQIYHQKMRFYKGDHDFLHLNYNDEKQDFTAIRTHHIVDNLAKNLVNTFAGFFQGIPVKVNYQPAGEDPQAPSDDTNQINEWISQMLDDSHFSDQFFEWAKKADIYGRSYSIAYINKSDNKLKFTNLSPENCLTVYDNTLDEAPLFSLKFNLIGGNFYGTLFTNEHQYDFGPEELENPDNFKAKMTNNPFGQIPVSELPENDERSGLFDDAIPMMDKLDLIQSLKINDVYYFSNAILFLKGFNKLTPEQRSTIKKWHVLQTDDNNDDNVDAKFLAKPQNDAQQQHVADDLKDEVFQNAGIINLSNPKLGESASGKALDKKLQPMTMLADSKARKMTNAIKELFRVLFTQCPYVDDSNVDEVLRYTNIKFTPNIPHSLLDESNIVKNLNGIVSLPTLISYLSNVNNVPDEIKRIVEERESNQLEFASGTVLNPNASITGQDDSGDGDVDNQDGEADDDTSDESDDDTTSGSGGR